MGISFGSGMRERRNWRVVRGGQAGKVGGGLTTAIRYVIIGVARSLSLHRLDKVFGYALRIDLAPEECISERVGCREESDVRRVWKAEGLCDVCLSVVRAGVCRRERGHEWKILDLGRDRQKDGRKASLSPPLPHC